METARLTMPLGSGFGVGGGGRNLSTGSSGSATASAVDAYATRILKMKSPPEACVDDSLGPYVTSLLRCSLAELPEEEYSSNSEKRADNNFDIKSIPEYESMIELLEEHCNVDEVEAQSVLQTIVTAVRTGVVENDVVRSNNNSSNDEESKNNFDFGNNNSGGDNTSFTFHHQDGALSWNATTEYGMDSSNFSGGNNNKPIDWTPTTMVESGGGGGGETKESSGSSHHNEYRGSSPYNNSNSSVVGGNTPNRLIPVDLMGVLDDPSTPKAIKQQIALSSSSSSQTTPPGFYSSSLSSPSLLQVSAGLQEETNTQNDVSSNNNEEDIKDLATTLFHGGEGGEGKSPELRPSAPSFEVGKIMTPLPPPVETTTTPSDSAQYYDDQQKQQHHYENEGDDDGELFQQQLDTCTEILLSMNSELGEEAAYEAALFANVDVNVAQYVINGAMAAPPICRHLLHDGCYRSDCTYSHDVDNHTCMFWLKGYCNQGYDSCRFLHGFSSNLLEGADTAAPTDDVLLQQQEYLSSPPPQGHTTSTSTSSSFSGGTGGKSKPVPMIETTNLVQHNRNNIINKNRLSYSAPQQNTITSSTFNHRTSFDSAFDTYPRSQTTTTTSTRSSSSSQLGTYNGQIWEPSTTTTTTSPFNATATTTSEPTSSSSFSFASIATKGYSKESFASSSSSTDAFGGGSRTTSSPSLLLSSSTNTTPETRKIPQDLWNAHENRDASAFRIPDPIERYKHVMSSSVKQREDVIDLHFQSTKTFPVVLSLVLNEKLRDHGEVWIVTGTGHHVGTKTHQKGGGSLESAVLSWLTTHGYTYASGKDRNGHGGATLVKR